MRRQLLTGLLMTVVMTVLLGFAYPFAVAGISDIAFKHQANGSYLTVGGKPIGSSLIGQNFLDQHGNPLPQYFQPRPSDAGTGYDAMASAASNLGPLNDKLIAECLPVQATDKDGNPEVDAKGNPVYEKNRDGSPVCNPNTAPQRAVAYRQLNGLAANASVPVDAVTASGSGLDPAISIANADLQAPRVAKAHHLALATVMAQIASHTHGRGLGFLGEKAVNVLELNLALDKLGH